MEKSDSIKKVLKEIKKDHYSLIVSLWLTQRKLERVREELKEKYVLTESSRMRAWRRDVTRGRQKGGLRKEKKRR